MKLGQGPWSAKNTGPRAFSPARIKDSRMRGNLYIVSAPSGSGKTTLLQHLLRNFKDLKFSVSFTTREARGHEQNGVDYYFTDRAGRSAIQPWNEDPNTFLKNAPDTVELTLTEAIGAALMNSPEIRVLYA